VTGTTKKRLTLKEWAEIEALWESGTVTLEDLEKQYGPAPSTLTRHFKKNKIEKGSRAAATKKAVGEKLAAVAVDDAVVLAARVRETKEQHYTMAANLAKLTWNAILEAKKNMVPVATAMNDLKALDTAMNVLKKAREERWAVLGLDRPDAVDPDELPDLHVAELTDEQIEELRSRDTAELDELSKAERAAGGTPEGEEDDDAIEEEGA
jgi:hypothetical protein